MQGGRLKGACVRRFSLAPRVGDENGRDAVYDPSNVDAVETIIAATNGDGADFMLESAGVPTITFPSMEKVLAVNAKIVQASRAATRVPIYLESFQVKAAPDIRCAGSFRQRHISQRN